MQNFYKRLGKSLFQLFFFFWILISSGTAFAAVTTTKTYLDNFDVADYNINDGTAEFLAGWVDTTGTAADADPFKIEARRGRLRVKNSGDANLSRRLDLSSASSATLEIDVEEKTTTDDLIIELWNSTSGWEEVLRINTTNTFTYDLTSDHMSSASAIRISIDHEGGDTGTGEYRIFFVKFTAEFPCGTGTAKTELTAYNWKVISFSCDTGGNGIEELLGASIGTYGNGPGEHWVMYEQVDYTGDNSIDMRKMDFDDTVTPGKGYWIISDLNVTAKIDTTLPGLSKTPIAPKTDYSGVTGSSFDDVMPYTLPNSQSAQQTKVMIGNPFLKRFQLIDMFYTNGSQAQYYEMGNIANDSYVDSTLYAHDSVGNGYIALTPSSTPGFPHEAEVMLGFWILMKSGNSYSNDITYPLVK